MDLRELFEDAVADVEPADRLEEIHVRTAAPRRAARPWWYVAGGVVAATAATVAIVAVVSDGDPADDPGHHDRHDQHVASDPELPDQVVPAYFVGDAPRGEARLFREFDTVPGGDPIRAALDRIQRPPTDPDYRTTWAEGSFETATLEVGVIEVELGDADPPAPDGIAAQQLVYTLQGAAGERLPVQLVDDGDPVGDPYEAAPQLDVLNLVSISDPAEGTAYVETETFLARGRASAFEGTVGWELRDEEEQVVREGFTTASGWVDRLYPWEAEVEVAGLPSGFYTFVALIPDASGGAEESLLSTDTRTIIVR